MANTIRFSVANDDDLIILKHRLGRYFNIILTECLYAYINDRSYRISEAAMAYPAPDTLSDIRIAYNPKNKEVEEYLNSVAPGKKMSLFRFVLRRANPLTAASVSQSLSLPPSYFQLSAEDRLIREKQKELELLLQKRKKSSNPVMKKADQMEAPAKVEKNVEHKKDPVSQTESLEAQSPFVNSVKKEEGQAPTGELFGMAEKLFQEY